MQQWKQTPCFIRGGGGNGGTTLELDVFILVEGTPVIVQFGPEVPLPVCMGQRPDCVQGHFWEAGASSSSSDGFCCSGPPVCQSLWESRTPMSPFSFQASSPTYGSSHLYSPDSSANSGPIISDVTELAPSSPSASPSSSVEER